VKQKIIMMVGLMGSGKSTIAKKLAEAESATLLSSDNIRSEFPGISNEATFKLLFERAKQELKNEKSIIIDATNTTMKSRRGALTLFRSFNAHKVAFLVMTPYEECINRLVKRENQENLQGIVSALSRYYLNFQPPMIQEGFDEIIIFRTCETPETDKIENLLKEQLMFDQKTKYHEDTLDVHTNKVHKAVSEKFLFSTDLTNAALLHDIGKPRTLSVDEDGQAHYYGHANVGSYLCLLNDDVSYETALLVAYHMYPYNWVTEKVRQKYLNIFGDEMYQDLLELNEADRKSHKLER